MKTKFTWSERCLYDFKYRYDVVKIYDRYGFILYQLTDGRGIISSTETYATEEDAYKAAYVTVNYNEK